MYWSIVSSVDQLFRECIMSMCQLSGKGMTARCLALIAAQVENLQARSHKILHLFGICHQHQLFFHSPGRNWRQLLQLGEIVPQCACFLKLWTNYIHFNREWAQCLGMIAFIKQKASSCWYSDPGWDSSSSLSHTLWVHPNFLFLSFPFLVVPLGMCSLLSLLPLTCSASFK